MPNIGLIVEGPYDEVAIATFVRRCRPGVTVTTRKCRGTVTGRVSGILAELDQRYKIERVLIISDADGRDPAEIISEIKSRVRGKYRCVVTTFVIVEMLETWLIADPAALKSVLGIKRSFPNPEKIPDPKSELIRQFTRSAGYTPEIARKIAESIDLKVLEKKCPGFLKFRRAVLGSAKMRSH
jgi:hypothetical protein